MNVRQAMPFDFTAIVPLPDRRHTIWTSPWNSSRAFRSATRTLRNFILSILAVAARRKARSLTIAHGDDYADYKPQVHPFLPVRRYRQAA